MSTTLKWGLITGMVYVIFSLISNMLGLQQGGSPGMGILMWFVQWVITFFTIFMGIKEAREQDLGGYMTFGQGFGAGMKISLIAGLIAALFTLIYMKIIDPEMGDKIMAAAEDQWEEAGMPEEQREMTRKWTGMFMNPFIMAPFMIIWIFLGGLIKSLIASAILKKEAPPVIPTA